MRFIVMFFVGGFVGYLISSLSGRNYRKGALLFSIWAILLVAMIFTGAP